MLDTDPQQWMHSSAALPAYMMSTLVLWDSQREHILFLQMYMSGECKSYKIKDATNFAWYLSQTILVVWEARNYLFFSR